MANSGIYSINNTTNGAVYSGAQSPRELFASNREVGWYPEAKFVQTYLSSSTFDAATVAPNCNTFLFWVFGAGGGSGGIGASSPGSGGTGGTTTLSGGVIAAAVGGIGSLGTVSSSGVPGTAVANAGTQGQSGNQTTYGGVGGPAAHYQALGGEFFTTTTGKDPSRGLTLPAGYHRHPLVGVVTQSRSNTPVGGTSIVPTQLSYTTPHSFDFATKVTGYAPSAPAYTVGRAELGQGASGSFYSSIASAGGQGGGFALATYCGIPSTVTITIGAGGTAGTTGGTYGGNVGGSGFVIVEGFIL